MWTDSIAIGSQNYVVSPNGIIAGEAGFLMTENMRKAFVAEYGCSPREYRQCFGTLGI